MCKEFRKKWPAIIIITILCWTAVSLERPVWANTGDTLVITAVPIAAVLTTAVAGYWYYQNRYAQPPDARGRLGYRGPGEFFVGGFLGGSFIQNATWDYRGPLGTRVSDMKIDPGITGGLKVGYFFDSMPFFGIEAEGSIGNQTQPAQTVRLNPPVLNSAIGQVHRQSLLVWTMAFHFLARYGFLATPEVPFGRLQPYVGLGPGLVMLYAEADSAKNFSLEVEAGLRYMFSKNFGMFVAYKLSQQWAVELESQQIFFANTGTTAPKAVFDFTRHQAILGLSYHF
jgi:opacity protein-like surface antigen